MTPEEFVKGFYLEKEALLELYFSHHTKTEVGTAVKSLNLNEEQLTTLKALLDGALTDMCYTILLGLDGAAQIGNRQVAYRIFDESGNELAGGEIEEHAWEYFHSKDDSAKSI